MLDKSEKPKQDIGQPEPPPPYSIADPEQDGGIVLSTTEDVPGFEIVKNHGVVFGATARRGMNFNMLKSGGEEREASKGGIRGKVSEELYRLTSLIQMAREEAIDRMITGVKATGANAACGLRFDLESIGQTVDIYQVTCCVTAVSVVPQDISEEI